MCRCTPSHKVFALVTCSRWKQIRSRERSIRGQSLFQATVPSNVRRNDNVPWGTYLPVTNLLLALISVFLTARAMLSMGAPGVVIQSCHALTLYGSMSLISSLYRRGVCPRKRICTLHFTMRRSYDESPHDRPQCDSDMKSAKLDASASLPSCRLPSVPARPRRDLGRHRQP